MEPPQQTHRSLPEHVHTTLREYGRKYLTRDCDEYTREHAGELLSICLEPVALISPLDLTPQVEPIHALFRTRKAVFSKGILAAAEERMPLSREAIQYLKSALQTQGKPSHCLEDPLGPDKRTYAWAPYHLMDTLLSRKSQKESPTLGDESLPKGITGTTMDLVRRLTLENMVVDPTEDPAIDQDQLLGVRLPLDRQTQSALRTLICTLPHSFTKPKATIRSNDHENHNVKAFITSDDSPDNHSIRRRSPPLFPRAFQPRPDRSGLSLGLQGLMEITGGKLDVQDEEYFAQENMALVDGWAAIPHPSSSLSSPTPSPTASRSSKIGDMWEMSSQGPLDFLQDARLEKIEMPRNRTVGHPLPDNTSLHYGITSIDQLGLETITCEENLAAGSEDRCVSPSLLGRASTVLEDNEQVETDDIQSVLERLYRPVRGHDPATLILREKLDQKQSLLMDVPVIHEMTINEPSLTAIPSLKGLLHRKQPAETEKSHPALNLGIKKLSGIAPLVIELPWRPFISGESEVPTQDSIANVQPGFADDSAVNSFLGGLATLLLQPQYPREYAAEDAVAGQPLPVSDPVLLSRSEMRSLAITGPSQEQQGGFDFEDSDDAVGPPRPTSPYASPDQQSDAAFAHRASPARLENADARPPALHYHGSPYSHPHSPLAIIGPQESRQSKDSILVISENLTSKRKRHPTPETNREKLRRLLHIRGKQMPSERALSRPPTPAAPTLRAQPADLLPEIRAIPQDFLAHASMHLPNVTESLPLPTTLHKYIVSFGLIQKRGIVSALCHPSIGNVDLIPRMLADVDLIIDPGSAVLYFALGALPIDVNQLAARLSNLSPSYSRILVIFESYPSSKSRSARMDLVGAWGLASDDDEEVIAEKKGLVSYAFSQPVLKAFKQLRRALVIAETTGAKAVGCVVEFAFALDETEAARYARMFGDRMQEHDKNLDGLLDDRSWLMEEVYEGEDELSELEGMNLFAAIAILSRVNLDSFIGEMTSEQRLEWFADAVGRDRMIRCNSLIEERWAAFAPVGSPYVITDAGDVMEVQDVY